MLQAQQSYFHLQHLHMRLRHPQNNHLLHLHHTPHWKDSRIHRNQIHQTQPHRQTNTLEVLRHSLDYHQTLSNHSQRKSAHNHLPHLIPHHYLQAPNYTPHSQPHRRLLQLQQFYFRGQMG